MKLNNKIYSVLFVSLFLFNGCGLPSAKSTNIILNINNMPNEIPSDIQAQLAWNLWNLDKDSIAKALADGARPFALAKSIEGLPAIPQGTHLSPYAIILEGYQAKIYMQENIENITTALDKVYECIQVLISNNISVDQGVTTLESNPTMREFVRQSIDRLLTEQNTSGKLDEEGDYALFNLERIQKLIDGK